MKKKMKHYDGEDGSVVETDTAQGQNANIGDDVRARAMAAMANQSSAPAPTPTKKAVGKAITKAAAEEKAEPKKAGPVQEAKDVVSGKGASMPKSFTAAGGSSKGSSSKADLSGLRFKAPDPLSRLDRTGRDINNWSMKSGGKVGSASKRADGIASKGKTRGKMC